MAKAGTAYLDIEGDFTKLNRQVARYASTLDRKFDPIHLRLDTKGGVRESKALAAAVRTVNLEGDRTSRTMAATSRSTDGLGAAMGRGRRQSEGLHGSLLRLRIMMGTLAAIPAGEGLYAFAGGAVAATSALGPLAGTLAAVPALAGAAAQAIGTLHLATGGIGDALKAAGAAQDAAGTNAAAALERTSQAAERVRTSEMALADSQRQVRYAQEQLTAARDDARRALADLEDQAERGRLSEQAAVISLRRAQNEVRRLANDPSASSLDLEEARLRVREARQDLEETRKDAGRARADYAKAEQLGVKGAPEVVAAERAKADAVRARDEAQRQLNGAVKEIGKAAGQASSAVSKLETEMDKLPPEARAFTQQLIDLRPQLDELRAAAGRDMFPGFSAGLTDAQKNLPVLERLLEQTGGAFGDVARDAGELVGSSAFGRDLALVAERNASLIEQGGDSTLHLANAIRHLVVSSGPFVDWLADTAHGWAVQAEQAAEAGRKTGDTERFLNRTRQTLERLGSITQSVGAGLYAIGDAGDELGVDMWTNVDRLAQRFEDWAESTEGQNALAAWFDQSRETGRKVADEIDRIDARLDSLGDRSTFDALAIAGSEAFMRMLSHSAERLAQEAPTLAEAFIRGWLEADAWGRLLAGAWLLSKFGGLGAFTRMGATAGGAFGGGMATGVAQSGAQARLAGVVRAWGPGLAAAAGVTFGPEFVKQLEQGLRTQTPDFDLPKYRAAFSSSILGPGLGGALDNLVERGDKLRDFGQKAEETFKRLQKAGDSRGLANLAGQARTLAQQFPSASSQLGRFADAAEDAARRAAGAFRDVSQVGGRSLRDIKTATAEVDFQIRNSLGPSSAAGKDAMSRNFAAAAKAVRKSMDAGVISTKTGTEQIEKYMVAALENMGFTREQAIRVRKGQDPVSGKAIGGKQNLTGKQRGGPIDLGKPTGDSVPALLERGEYVLNREAVKHVGRDNLDRINFGAAPRFQTGGSVSRYQGGGIVELLHPFNDPSGHGGSNSHLHVAMRSVAAVIALGKRLQKLGWLVSEHPSFGGVRGRHAPGGYHYSQQAIDVNWPDPAREGSKIKALLSKLGDVAAGAGAGGADPSTAEKIARVMLDGPQSPLKSVAQGALDTTRAAAQSVVDNAGAGAAASPIEGAEVVPGKGAASRSQMVGWARTALKRTGIFPPTAENVEKILTLARKESSWIVDSMNLWDSNAKAGNPSGGLMHVTIDKVGGSMARLHDPVENMMASIRYQKQEYGRLVTRSPYRLGGLVEMLQSGGLVELQRGGEPKSAGGTQQKTTGKVKLEKPGERSSSKDDKSAARKWSPGAYQHRISHVLSGAIFEQLEKRVQELSQVYDNTERAQGLTEENATKSIPLRQATDAELAAHGLNPEQIGRMRLGTLPDADLVARGYSTDQIQDLRAEQDQMVELLNPPDIQRRVGELDSLVGIKNQVSEALSTQQSAGAEALRQFQAGFEERVRRAAEIRERVERNLEKIRELQERAAEMDREERRAKTEKARERLEKRHAPERKRIARDLDRLRDDNQRLTGARRIDDVERQLGEAQVALRDGGTPDGGGALGATVRDAARWKQARDEIAPDAATIGQKLVDMDLDRQFLLKERREWLETPPPGVDVPVAPEPEGAKTDERDNSELVELLRQQVQQANQRTAVAESHYATFKQWDREYPFGGVFHQGGVVPGPRGQERMILAQAGETVLPLGADGGQPVQVQVIIRDGAVDPNKIEVIATRAAANVTRQQARHAGRLLPGGTRGV